MNEPLNNSGIQASIARLLSETTKQLALFLADVLPAIADDWWQEAVFNKLSFNQQRTLEQSENISLGALDLAALLRIFDFNWRDISSKCDFRLEARNYAKEMQTIRNRWAHAGAEGFPAEDVYRDLDTLQRFIDVIGGAESLIQDVRDVKNTIIPKVAPPK